MTVTFRSPVEYMQDRQAVRLTDAQVVGLSAILDGADRG